MTSEELLRKYVREPTEEMYKIAKVFHTHLDYSEGWFCDRKTVHLAIRTSKLLTETDEWKNINSLHYGATHPYHLYNLDEYRNYKPKADTILNKIDVFIDSIIKSNPEFFINFPIDRIIKNDLYNFRGEYIGRCLEFITIGKYNRDTTYTTYTDGIIEMDTELFYNNDHYRANIRDYTLVLQSPNRPPSKNSYMYLSGIEMNI